MKLKCLIFALCFSALMSAKSDKEQVNKATYTVTVNTDLYVSQDELLKKIKNSPVIVELYFNSYASIFKREKAMNNSVSNKDDEITMAKAVAGRGIRYINTNTKEHIYQRKSFFIEDKKRAVVNIIYPYNEYKWIITKEHRIISGYTCYKAIATLVRDGIKGNVTENITAWFTPQISAPFGPKGIGGLPGLIIFVNYSNKIFFSLQEIIFDIKDFKIEKPKDGKPILKREYDSIQRANFPFMKKLMNKQ